MDDSSLQEAAAAGSAGCGQVESGAEGTASAAPVCLLHRQTWLFAAALAAAVFLAYQPAWHGGFVMDDDAHVPCPELRTWHGLYRIWFELGVTQQYSPLLESSFWLQYKLWGSAATGYHLVNIAWHVLAALLVLAILRRLKVPGAYLAASIFALHPVHVESVAWITEQKNTFSAVFYLLAALAYLRFDEKRSAGWYLAALGLFVAALASKVVTVTLPAALLVVFWWQRGKLSWRRDVLPLLPFFAVGAAAGVLGAWVERRLVGAAGAEFALSVGQRCLLSGRVVCFYFAKLVWPANLTFIYPRWQISPTVWRQYLFPAAVLLAAAGLWLLRRRWRGPLAGFLFFVGTLFPVLGFLNVYWSMFSFVADHHQYLASLGVITVASAGLCLLLNRWPQALRAAGYVVCLALLATLAGLTWRQSRMYADLETLYRATIARNSQCWLAQNNLGWDLAARGKTDEAVAHYRQALAIRPDYELARNNLELALAGHGKAAAPRVLTVDQLHNNVGLDLARHGKFDEAVAEYQKALEIKPDYAEAHNNLAAALAALGRIKEAISHYQTALKLKPDYADAHNNLGNVLNSRGERAEAISQYEQALEVKPDHAQAHNNLGAALAARGQLDEAIAHYQQALKIKPNYADAHNNLGSALAGRGQFGEAIVHYRKVLELRPSDVEARNNLGSALASRGQLDEAVQQYRKVLEIKPGHPQAGNYLAMVLSLQEKLRTALANQRAALQVHPDDVALLHSVAWLLATSSNASLRNGADAVELAERGAKLSGGVNPEMLDTLAAAYAETGRFAEALRTARRALELATRENNKALVAALPGRIKLYQARQPYREMR